MTNRIIYHIDVNNAFLSWEAVDRIKNATKSKEVVIDLRNIPSAIGGSQEKRHGIILAKSTPAKKYGIRTAETIVDALKKCPSLVLVPPRYPIYEQASFQFINILKEYSDCIEKYSIDEVFMDMTSTYHLYGDTIQTAYKIKDHIYKELGFTVNIGISSNKLLAKMASDFPNPNSVYTLFPNEMKEKMWPLPVRNLFLVGKSAEKKLKTLGIHTIGDLARSDFSFIKSHFGKKGELIYSYSNGIDFAPVTSKRQEPKGYGNSTTIDHDVTEASEAKNILLSLCETIGSRLRKNQVSVSVIAVTIKDQFLLSKSHQLTLPSATNVTSELYQYACQLFDELWEQTPIRLLGIQTSKITKENFYQFNLFDSDKFIRQEKVEQAIDEIRKKFGNDSIMRASFIDQPNKHMIGKQFEKPPEK